MRHGRRHILALRRDEEVVAWGNNTSGVSTVSTAALRDVIAITARESHSGALKSDGSVVAWEANGRGESTVPATAHGVTRIDSGPFSLITFYRVGAAPAPAALEVPQAVRNGDSFILNFSGPANLMNWRLEGSADPQIAGEDLNDRTTFTSLGPGSYRAVINVAGKGERYFVRIRIL